MAASIRLTISKEEIAFLGIKNSPAFVRAPEGNGCAERFVRILKPALGEDLPQCGGTVLGPLEFKRTYNENWIIQRHGYKTPVQVR